MSRCVRIQRKMSSLTRDAECWKSGKNVRNWGAVNAGFMIFLWRWWAWPAEWKECHRRLRRKRVRYGIPTRNPSKSSPCKKFDDHSSIHSLWEMIAWSMQNVLKPPGISKHKSVLLHADHWGKLQRIWYSWNWHERHNTQRHERQCHTRESICTPNHQLHPDNAPQPHVLEQNINKCSCHSDDNGLYQEARTERAALGCSWGIDVWNYAGINPQPAEIWTKQR